MFLINQPLYISNLNSFLPLQCCGLFSYLQSLSSDYTIFYCLQSATGNSWLGSLIGTIIGNLKISIGNVHIRYEDSVRLVYIHLLFLFYNESVFLSVTLLFSPFDQKSFCMFSNPGHPFAVGVTLAKLAAFTVDEQGNETFDTSGALDKLRKVNFVFHLFHCSPKMASLFF